MSELDELCIVSQFLLTKQIWKQNENLVLVNTDAMKPQ